MNYHQVLRDMRQIARDAGEIIMSAYHQPVAEVTKSSDVDIVTETDKAVEVHIVSQIHAKYPGHHIVGEEGGGMGAPRDSASYLWFVDPIDGTTNFANKIPFFSVSLALTDAELNPLVGVVYHPSLDELFHAIRGEGAYLNDDVIQVSQTDNLLQAVIVSGFGYDKRTSTDNNIAEWAAFVTQTRGVRRMGSAALDCCYVACGRFDGYWERKLSQWDIMAGSLIVHESGGLVTDYQGTPFPFGDPAGKYLMTNAKIHVDMQDILESVAE